jgi:hypothetical protein
VIAWLLRTKQAQFIRRLRSTSSPQPSPPLFVEGEGLEFGRSYGGWQRILGMFQSIFNFAAGA